MASADRGTVAQQARRNAEIDAAAERLRELLEVQCTTEEIVDAVVDVERFKNNKEVLLRFQREVFNAKDWSTETLRRNLTEDFVDHAAMEGDPPGLEGVQLRFSGWASAFEEPLEVNEAILGRGDLMSVMYNLHAKHAGQFMGVEPTDRDVVIPGMEVVRIRDGKIAEHWGIYDFLRTAEEIGADLAFLPRGEAADGSAKRPEAPWAVRMTESHAEDISDAAERYLQHKHDSAT
jgi:predicted SnoaL-like aldol condensation-catalyzing enzyme